MDDEELVRAKAREMAEMLFGHHEPTTRALVIEHFREDIEERVRDFYAENGQWPVFKRDPGGREGCLVMGTKEEISEETRQS
jgi:hypothetical protein